MQFVPWESDGASVSECVSDDANCGDRPALRYRAEQKNDGKVVETKSGEA